MEDSNKAPRWGFKEVEKGTSRMKRWRHEVAIS